MIAIILLLRLSLLPSVALSSPQTAQKFLYRSSDILNIQALSIFTMSLSLTTAADEYLSGSSVEVTVQIEDNSSPTLPYNLYYFNYQNQEGQQCYQQWITSGIKPKEFPCPDSSTQSLDLFPSCAKFLDCNRQIRNLTLVLNYEMYKECYMIIENPNAEMLSLQTDIFLELSSENTWFYWGVGLTCLLLISLVIFTGVVFYWMLKYKRVKKMFENFKLTTEAVTKIL